MVVAYDCVQELIWPIYSCWLCHLCAILLFTCLKLLGFSIQVKVFVEGLFHLDKDIPQFKEHLRDFLVQIKVHTCTYVVSVTDIILYNICKKSWVAPYVM